MASFRVPTLRLLLVLVALVPFGALAAGCGSDADSATARVAPGAGEKPRTPSEGAADPQVERDAGEDGGRDAAPADLPAGEGMAPGEPPYEGDGDGDSSDDGGSAGVDGGAGAGGAGAGAADGAGSDPAASAAPDGPAAGGQDGSGTGGTAASAPAGAGGVEAGEAGAGDEDGVAVPASFVVEGGGATPMRVEVPAFLGIALEVENAEVRPIEVRLRAPGAEAFVVGPGQRVTRRVTGVPPGLYPLEVDGGASGAVVVAAG